jgi:zinc transporter, ZIP family
MSQTKKPTINASAAINGYDNAKSKADGPPKTGSLTIFAFVILVIITVVTIPTPFQPVGKPTILHVWYYGWITAISTGFGVLPLVFTPEFDSYWVGISNGE